ncbi:MAG: CHRD domain-containing protein [Thermaerobacterales bacterium]
MKKLFILLAALTLVAALAIGAAAQTQFRTFISLLSPGEEVHEVVSDAHGIATFNISQDGQSVRFHLNVSGLEDITMAHLHRAPEGSNGPVVVWLYPSGPPPQTTNVDGLLARGTITPDNLGGSLAGDWEGFISEMRAGNLYANVHTLEYGAGEIRGQLRTNASFRSK